MSSNLLKGKNILVTAGSTWVPIDTVRVITNIFKGSIGFTIAKVAVSMGANVTLLLGPSFDISSVVLPKSLKVVRFKFFDELDSLVSEYLKTQKFDAMIHSAAVSDFQLAKAHEGKIKSSADKLILELVPTKKIVDGVKKLAPKIFLVKFKLEVGLSEGELKKVAMNGLKQSNADLIVANIYNPKFTDHEAFIIDSKGNTIKAVGRDVIAKTILKEIYARTRPK